MQDRSRLLSILLTMLLASAALAGCATDDDGDGTTTTPTGATPTPTGATPTPTTPTSTTPALPTLPVSGPADDYGMTSGSATGVYYAIANGIAGAVRNATAAGFTISEVATSQGSVQNAQRIAAGDHQFAMMQNDVAYFAYNGNGSFAGSAVTDLRVVASLYPEMVQLVTLKSNGYDSIEDLAGKRVVLGAAGSGAAVNADQILNASGVTVDRQYMDLTTGLDRLKDGGVDAVFWTGGIPTGALTSLATTNPVTIIPIDGETKATLQASAPFFANATLPANTYTGQDADVQTVAVMAILVAHKDVAADDVNSLLRIIFDGTAVQNSHAQGKNIKLDNAFVGVVGVPYHDGATFYYASKGKVPPSTS